MADSFSGLFGPDAGYATLGTGTLGVGTVTLASTGAKFSWIVPFKAYVRRIALVITQTPAGSAGVVDFRRRPTADSATGETTIGTLKVLSTYAAGTVVYLDIASTVAPLDGDTITVQVTGTDATLTQCYAYAVVRQSPEVAANITHMVATT